MSSCREALRWASCAAWRRVLRAWPLVGAVLLAAGCGFQLRGQGDFSFTSIYVTAPSSPPFEAELRRTIGGSGPTSLAESATSAQVVLTVSEVTEDKSVLSLSSG